MPQTPTRLGTQFCARCEKYLRDYERDVEKIYEALSAPFPSLWEKIDSLRKRQEKRDHAIEAYYFHKRSHHHKRKDLFAA